MKRTAMAFAVLFGAGVAAGSGAQNLDQLSHDELAKRAEAEGKVVIYSFTSRITSVKKAFEAKYPKIEVVAFDINSTQMIARLKSEAAANIGNADVAYISDIPMVIEDLIKPGIFMRHVPPAFATRVPAEFQQPLLANRLSTKVVMYNEEAHPNGPPVKNLWDLTKPEWRGRVVTVDPTVRGDYLDLMTEIVLRSDDMAKAYAQAFGKPIQLSGKENAGEQWLRTFLANKPVFVANTDAVNDAVGKRGQANPPIGITTYSDRRDNKSRGRALQIATGLEPATGIVFPASFGLVRGGKNPAAARLLIHFMMGDDTPGGGAGYAPFYVAGDYATRTDIAPHPDALPLATLNAWRIDPAKTAAARKRVADFILARQ